MNDQQIAQALAHPYVVALREHAATLHGVCGVVTAVRRKRCTKDVMWLVDGTTEVCADHLQMAIYVATHPREWNRRHNASVSVHPKWALANRSINDLVPA